MSNESIPGYTKGDAEIPSAPISTEEFDQLKQTVMFTDEDEEYLQMAGDVLADQTEDILDVWYGFVGDHDFLLYYFTDGDGEPNDEYLDRVRARFRQWIRDTCDTPYDQEWLDYQFEIARRHHRTKKNQADEVESVPNIDFRYIAAFIYPITATIRDFLTNGDHTSEEVDKMYHAWFKAVVLQVTLWSYPYIPDDDW